jgi:hypothetical protein
LKIGAKVTRSPNNVAAKFIWQTEIQTIGEKGNS